MLGVHMKPPRIFLMRHRVARRLIPDAQVRLDDQKRKMGGGEGVKPAEGPIPDTISQRRREDCEREPHRAVGKGKEGE